MVIAMRVMGAGLPYKPFESRLVSFPNESVCRTHRALSRLWTRAGFRPRPMIGRGGEDAS